MSKTLHKLTVPFKYNDKILQKSTDARIYRDCILLTPGDWTDASTMAPVEYSMDELQKSATMWESEYLNLDHSFHVLDRIGHVRNQRWFMGAVAGDLYIYPVTNAARDSIALIDSNLINELSVELYCEELWDSDTQIRKATDIRFVGLALVTRGACSETRVR